MKNLFNRFLTKISLSLNGHTHEVSTPRLQSYLVLIAILMMMIGALVIEMWSFINAIYHTETYKMSNEFIVVFGMALGHHLSILFSRNKVSKNGSQDDDGSQEDDGDDKNDKK